MFKKRVFPNGKKGVEWEIGKLLVAIVVLVIMMFAAGILIKGKGGELLSGIKNLFRFGRAFLAWL